MDESDLFLFVSHVAQDRAAALEIVDELERRGVKCWIAPRNVHPGSSFDDEIADALDNCRAMLLIFSEHCNESEYIHREVTVAGESHKIVIPFRIEDVQPRRGLRVRLSDLHWIDGFASRERAVDELARQFVSPEAAQQRRGQEEEERLREEAELSQRAAAAERQKEQAEERQRQEAEQRRPPLASIEAKAAELGWREEAARLPAQRQSPAGKLWILALLAVLVLAAGIGLFIFAKAPPVQQAATQPDATVQPKPAPAQPAPPQATVPTPAPAPQASPRQPVPAPPAVTPQPAPAALPAPGQTFRDCPDCPEMVVVPPGSFMMGSDPTEQEGYQDERPRHMVTLKNTIVVGKYDILRAEYTKFVQATGRNSEAGCTIWTAGSWKPDSTKSWWNPGFVQTDRDPVVCENWNDAKAYAAWLSQVTGKAYRLLTEAEWEYAARAGTTTARYWGEAIGTNNANCNGCGSRWDGKSTSPAGSFKPNGFGLYDMLGNVWQWGEDCYVDNYRNAPTDGGAVEGASCSDRILRGGGWAYENLHNIRAANRYHAEPSDDSSSTGFRLIRAVTP